MCKPTSQETLPTRLLNFQQVIEAPSEFDVLCGSKSTSFNNHPGNHLFRQKVHSCLASYEAARTKQEKMKINRQIVAFMRTKFGSRFLKQFKDGTWAIAQEQSIRDKVSHAFRYAAQRKEKEEQVAVQERQHHHHHQQQQHKHTLHEVLLESNLESELFIPPPPGLLSSDGDSQSVLVDEVHRRQLSILGVMLSQKAKEDMDVFDDDHDHYHHRQFNDESLSGLSNNEWMHEFLYRMYCYILCN